jgi:SAM-dependent methyltransferase
MKTRESGMPDADVWEGFFDPECVLRSLGLHREVKRVVDLGCGYGTFSLSAAAMIDGEVIGLDIEPDLVALCRRKAREAGFANTRFEHRDFIAAGTGLEDGSVDYVMLFNILHAKHPDILLREAGGILAPSGLLAVMHWNYDEKTPRGPSMAIRPQPDDCRRWVEACGFVDLSPTLSLPPWHYGFTARTNNNHKGHIP